MTQTPRILDPVAAANLQAYLDVGGGSGLTAAIDGRTPESLIELVEQSGLRGRGGAGFPTGRKWRSIAATVAEHGTPVMVINGAEGEPGTFKDRLLLRRNPYLVLEGACIAARAVGATRIIVATKATFSHEAERLHRAIAEVGQAGWTDEIEITLVEGPDEYLYGEETGLLEVIDGRPPFPRVAPPFRRGLGPVEGPTALVDNVETLANIPGIVSQGSDWFRSVGTDQSPGTILCTVTGDAPRHGVGEFAMGTPLREVLHELGGLSDGIGAVLSGVSNPPLGPDQLDTAVSYEAMIDAGTGLGSASFIVIGAGTRLRSVAAGVARFLSVESCGQCEPCKRDSLALSAKLQEPDDHVPAGARAGDPNATAASLLASVATGARCALAGQTERVVGRLLTLDATAVAGGPSRPVADAAASTSAASMSNLATTGANGAVDDAGATDGAGTTDDGGPADVYPIVPLVELDDGELAVLDLGHLDKLPDWTFGPGPWSGEWPAQRLIDQPVEITMATRAEPEQGEGGTDPAPPAELFTELRQRGAELEELTQHLRHSSGSDQPAGTLDQLQAELERHIRTTQGLIYPLIDRLAPELGDDVTWYPAHHERQAMRLLDQVQTGSAVSPRQVDEITAAVHIAVKELEERILPRLDEVLRQQPQEALELDRQAAELLGEA